MKASGETGMSSTGETSADSTSLADSGASVSSTGEASAGLMSGKMKVIFFGNGKLAEEALKVLSENFEIIFHARAREDLAEAVRLKRENPEAIGVLASFGVLIKTEVLEVFEPEGILNIHPSLLPKFRGASPIESAILAGETEFSVSVMKLAKAMDAGPVYFQKTISGLPLDKGAIYTALARAGAEWIVERAKETANVDVVSGDLTSGDSVAKGSKVAINLPEPKAQNEEGATFCGKLTKEMGILEPEKESAEAIWRKIVAFQGFPKAKYQFFNVPCIILKAHILGVGEKAILELPCATGVLSIDEIQPEGRKKMDAKSFVNGYGRKA